MNVRDLIADPPKLHFYDGEPVDWGLHDQQILFLYHQVTEGTKTIETGAGVSTVAFAMKGAEHTCIVPDEEQVNRIRLYCDEHDISYANIKFIVERSEYALPGLEDKDFDLALIDGDHAFPVPFIDWFYIADRLKLGGLLIIDDLWLWPCETLMQFLLAEEDWILLEEGGRAAVFVKQGNNAQHKGWEDQVFLVHRSRVTSLSAEARHLLNLLKRRKFLLFGSAIAHHMRSAMPRPVKGFVKRHILTRR